MCKPESKKQTCQRSVARQPFPQDLRRVYVQCSAGPRRRSQGCLKQLDLLRGLAQTRIQTGEYFDENVVHERELLHRGRGSRRSRWRSAATSNRVQSRRTQLGHSVAWTECGGRGSRATMYTHEYQMAPFLVRDGKTTKLLHLTVRCVARGRGALSEHST